MKIVLTSWMPRDGLSDFQESVGHFDTQTLSREFLHSNCEAPLVFFQALTELCSNTWPEGKVLVCSPCFEGSREVCKAASGPSQCHLCFFGAIAVQGLCEGKWAKASSTCSQTPSFVFEWFFLKINFSFFLFYQFQNLVGTIYSQGHSSTF